MKVKEMRERERERERERDNTHHTSGQKMKSFISILTTLYIRV